MIMGPICYGIVTGLFLCPVLGGVGVLNHRWIDWYDKRIGILEESDIAEQAKEYHTRSIIDISPAVILEKYRETCTIELPTKEPDNVHEMSIGDVDVLAALGDAFTSATGATAADLTEITHDSMDYSWITGGNPDQVSLINLLRHFKDSVLGASENGTIGFNMAKPGSVASDLPDQARQLVDAMTRDERVDNAGDWKVITIFMGVNDLCWMCAEHELIASEYSRHLLTALTILKAGLPHSIVSVVLPPFMPLWEGPTETKAVTQEAQSVECHCMRPPTEEFERLLEAMKQHHLDLLQVIKDAVLEASLTTVDFAIVLQPCLVNLSMPLLPTGDRDAQYFAPDYYHFNTRGQASMAIAVWNGLFERVFEKTYNTRLDQRKITCPGEYHYIGTRWNTMKDRNITIEDPAQDRNWGSNELIIGLGVTIGFFVAAAGVAVVIMMFTNNYQKSGRRESLKPVVHMDQLANMDKDDGTFLNV